MRARDWQKGTFSTCSAQRRGVRSWHIRASWRHHCLLFWTHHLQADAVVKSGGVAHDQLADHSAEEKHADAQRLFSGQREGAVERETAAVVVRGVAVARARRRRRGAVPADGKIGHAERDADHQVEQRGQRDCRDLRGGVARGAAPAPSPGEGRAIRRRVAVVVVVVVDDVDGAVARGRGDDRGRAQSPGRGGDAVRHGHSSSRRAAWWRGRCHDGHGWRHRVQYCANAETFIFTFSGSAQMAN